MYDDDHPSVKEYDNLQRRYSMKSSVNANKKRCCTYCYESGHNRRTCSWLKAHKKSLIEENYRWRKSVIEIFKRDGINLGSLISYSGDEQFWINQNKHDNHLHERNDLWMLIRINWDNINFFEPWHVIPIILFFFNKFLAFFIDPSD